MAKQLQQWLETEVQPFRDKSVAWLSQLSLFPRPYAPDVCGRELYFFAPADGIIIYQRTVRPDECIVQLKGRAYSLGDALRDPHFDAPSLVIGIFMTFFDVHVNRMGERNHE